MSEVFCVNSSDVDYFILYSSSLIRMRMDVRNRRCLEWKSIQWPAQVDGHLTQDACL